MAITEARKKVFRRTESGDEVSAQAPGQNPDLPPIEDMEYTQEELGLSEDSGDESDGSTQASDEEEFFIPESPKTSEPETAEEASPIEELKNLRKPPGPSPKKRVTFQKKIPAGNPKQNADLPKHKIGQPSTAGPRTGHPEGETPSQEGQVPPTEILAALRRRLDYREITNSPSGTIPSLIEPLTKMTKLCTEPVAPGSDPESSVRRISRRWHQDTRKHIVAADPPSTICKLGLATTDDNGDHHPVHVRAITGSELPAKDTGPLGLPVWGFPQLKIVDLNESVKEAIKYLRYLNALIVTAADLPEDIALDLEFTHIWLDQQDRANQIDITFKCRELALFVLFNTTFRLPLHAQPQSHQNFSRHQKVIPSIYVWSPWRPVRGPASARSLIVHGAGLSGKSIEDLANFLAAEAIFNEESQSNLGQLVDKIKKGTNREPVEDATLREVLLLEATSPEAAEELLKRPYDWGVPTNIQWLPSREKVDEAARREVAIVDYRKTLFSDHRKYIVKAITEHITSLTSTTIRLTSTKDIFQPLVATRQWAPSSYDTPASLVQWKRNSEGTHFTFYATFTPGAYTALREAGKQMVQVLAGLDKEGRRITTPVAVEVGRWSEYGEARKGTGTHPSQARAAGPGGAERREQLIAQAATEAITKVEAKASDLLQLAAKAAGGGTTPETKKLMKHISKQLLVFNQKQQITPTDLLNFQKKQESSAERRHTEIKTELTGFHQTYRDTGAAMVTTLEALTTRLTAPVVSRSTPSVQRGSQQEGVEASWQQPAGNTAAAGRKTRTAAEEEAPPPRDGRGKARPAKQRARQDRGNRANYS